MQQDPEVNIFSFQQIMVSIYTGKNVPGKDELDKYIDGFGFPFYPVGKYPPNPLGLYDMGLSGSEWTNDWYASDYYSHSPVNDPQGPAQGTKKSPAWIYWRRQTVRFNHVQAIKIASSEDR